MRGVAIALGALILGGCAPPAGPPPRCAEAWREVPAPRRTYDFSTDEERTERGNEGYTRFADRLPRRGCVKAWTVLVYMAADADDLGAPALRDLRSIEDASAGAASTEEADVIVEIDRKEPPGLLRMHLFRAPSPSPLGARSPIVEALPEPEAKPEEALGRFLAWGMERYPAERYAVIVWGHGLGYRPRGAPPARWDRAGTSGGIAFDESQGTVIDTDGLRDALTSASRAHHGGKPIDLYASDACLMQSIEVAGELASAARYVIGSEQIEEDYVGLPYRTWLPMLNGTARLASSPRCERGDVACDAAAAIAPAMRDELARTGAAAPGLTLSALDEATVRSDLVPSLRALGAAIEVYLGEDDLRRIALSVLLGAERGPTRGTPSFRGGTRDVGVLLERLEAAVKRQARTPPSAAEVALLAAVASARGALGRAVITSAFGARFAAPGHEGMAGVSLWLPRDADEMRARAGFFAPSVLHRGSPSFRGFLDKLWAPPPS